MKVRSLTFSKRIKGHSNRELAITVDLDPGEDEIKALQKLVQKVGNLLGDIYHHRDGLSDEWQIPSERT